MQQYAYAQIETAEPYPGEDGSRVISFFVFNTDVHFHVYCGDGRERTEDEGAGRTVEALDDALRACRDRCLFFERHLSRTRSDSDISRAHAASPHPIDVAPETAELVRLACGYCARSRGCFDTVSYTHLDVYKRQVRWRRYPASYIAPWRIYLRSSWGSQRYRRPTVGGNSSSIACPPRSPSRTAGDPGCRIICNE